jgi:putative sporulation protein YtaF
MQTLGIKYIRDFLCLKQSGGFIMLSLCILAFSVSLDSLGAGFTYGLKNIRIPFLSRFIICFISLLCALLATNLGGILTTILPLWAGSLVSTLILLGLGVYMLYSSVRETNSEGNTATESQPMREYHWGWQTLELTVTIMRHPVRCDINRSNTIDALEALLLGIAFSLDAFGMGIGYGLMGDIWKLPILTAFFHFVLLSLGQFMGRIIRKKLLALDKILSFVPGIILILLGILRFLGIL